MFTEIPRLEGVGKVTGSLRYTSDLEVTGMVHGKILRSPHPHAKIVSIDKSEASSLPGVLAVITAADTNRNKFGFMQEIADKQILCENKVRFVGDEVAAVAATTIEIAEEALNCIKVDYEVLPPVLDVNEAQKPDAPRMHDKGNVALSGQFGRGSILEGMREADDFLEADYETQRQAHVCFEPRCCIAEWDATGNLIMTTTTQTPHTLRQEISRMLDLPISKVRVVYPPMGGGFGNRLVTSMLEPIAALLALRCGRPVKITNTREEEFATARTRYPFKVHVKSGYKSDGTITALDITVVSDNGAYNDKGPAVMGATRLILNHYSVPCINVNWKLVYTNQQPCTGFRGFGLPQMQFALESHLDELAEKLHKDPIEIRMKNSAEEADRKCIKTVVDASGFMKKRGKEGRSSDIILRGIGIATSVSSGSGTRIYGHNSSGAMVKISEDGTVTLITAAVDLGTGAETVLAQIVAETLGIPLEFVHVAGRDTNITSFDLGALGSRTTFVHGWAAKAAAEDAKKGVLAAASKLLDCDTKELEIHRGIISSRTNDGKRTSFEKAARYSTTRLNTAILGKGMYVDDKAVSMSLASGDMGETTRIIFREGEFAAAVGHCAAVAEVEVDKSTGRITVPRYWAAVDCGRVLNPLGARGQTIGSIAQGIGYALFEEITLRDGQVINPTFVDYKIASMNDMPEINVAFIEHDDPRGPYGGVGLAELSIEPVAAAVANAICDATGIRFRRLPISPERVLFALKGSSGDQSLK